MKLPPELSAKFAKILDEMPDASVHDVLQQLTRADPLIFCMVKRKLRGLPLLFDNSKALSAAELHKIQVELRPEHFDKEKKIREQFHRPWLIQPMRDNHPHKTYQKGRQIGVSELGIIEVAFFLFHHPARKWVYTFPRETQLKQFSATRILPMFDETPQMRELLTATPGTFLLHIGESFLLLRSAWESNLGEGIDADGVTFDEKDRMKDNVDIAFKESLSSSAYGYMRDVSTPTLPGRGVNASFSRSDQMTWLVKCSRCGMKQEILYPDNIVQMMDVPLGVSELPSGAYEYLCRKSKCRGILDRTHGEWVAKYPDRKLVRGYHIPQTIALWINATELMQKKINYKIVQLWTNYCLGLPAMGDSVLVHEQDFETACAGHALLTRRTRDWDTISAGIDWGHLNWCVVRARNVHNGRFYIIGIKIIEDDAAPLSSAKAMESYLAPFNPDVIVADAGYGKDRNAYLKRKFDPLDLGKFYACTYNASTRHSRTLNPTWSDAYNARVLVDRTITLKRTAQSIREREIGLPDLNTQEMQLYQRHWRSLAPLILEEEGELFEEVKNSGDDHLAHADSYAFLGTDKLTRGGFFRFDFV